MLRYLQVMKSFTGKYLDPGSRMGELLFGLIMTLTFTLAAGLVIEEEGRAGATGNAHRHPGLQSGLGHHRRRALCAGFRIRARTTAAHSATQCGKPFRMTSRASSSNANSTTCCVPVTDEPQRRTLYSSIVDRLRDAPPPPNHVRRADIVGGIVSGWIVFACSFPAVLPFLVIDDPHRALRVSNAILLALLFLVGYRSAQHTMAKPWLTGMAFLLVGVFLVALAIPLGG